MSVLRALMHELRELNPHGSLFSPDSAHKCKPPNTQQGLATRALRFSRAASGCMGHKGMDPGTRFVVSASLDMSVLGYREGNT